MAAAQGDPEAHLVAEDEISDSEQDLESIRSETTSVKDSILEYRIENGRSYHKYKDGNMQHEICLLTFHERLGLAPPCDEGAKVGRVLDLGTGTGLWAVDYGNQHPEAEVSAVSLSVPPNVKFEVDDVEEEWLYSRPFDYIHLRFMNGSISDWTKIIQKAYDHLVPGGYFEIQEGDFVIKADDDTLPPEKPLAQFTSLIREAAEKFGRRFAPISEIRESMVDVGFENVAQQDFKWPSNPWPKDEHYKKIGEWNFHNFVDAAEAMALAPLTRGHDWTKEEVQVFLVGVRKDMRDRKIHSYMPM
ncbi:S-adenosyl-L-methionine-dependent methyltransferase [Colletotrichum godetiae]|uniref:S-adenosyl-L-methionine-dependent methyltransferase n=1 Tax=Colletotrichum godetiae TaxID=1209918 RepID=A0AAJ0AUI5_9PEZI|nr:S-adenosyl-L-methionine-dependent methyltransferase [Colletotrichum godetiae]KAK1690621.1 S-adenosyl-L-methionine-dependent methyltransferase [Colletotrichum godetiae]